MHSTLLLSALSGLALVNGQTSSALPPTIQGANTYNPPGVPGVSGLAGNASVTQNNPKVSYQAILPNSATSGIRGSIVGSPTANGTGILFTVGFVGFPPASLGPFGKCLRKDASSYSKRDVRMSLIIPVVQCTTSTTIPYPLMVTAQRHWLTSIPHCVVRAQLAMLPNHRPARSAT